MREERRAADGRDGPCMCREGAEAVSGTASQRRADVPGFDGFVVGS